MTFRSIMLAAAIVMAGCSYLPFSGGRLEGELTDPPADWTDVARADVVELETQPADPYSVKIWIVGKGAGLYVHAGANLTTWVEHIEANPDVRVLIGTALYELRAQQVTDAAEYATFSDAYEAKYGVRPRNENVAEVYCFRLVPRG